MQIMFYGLANQPVDPPVGDKHQDEDHEYHESEDAEPPVQILDILPGHLHVHAKQAGNQVHWNQNGADHGGLTEDRCHII